jgi:YVTN family beta-propeller protein
MASQGKELAYVSNSYGDTISVIDAATNELIDTIPMDFGTKKVIPRWPEGEVEIANAPMNPTFTPDGRLLYVADSQGSNIAVIDPQTNTVTETIDLDMRPCDLAFTPDGGRMVVTLINESPFEGQGAVMVMELATGKELSRAIIGTNPEEVAITPDGSRAYAVSNSLWAIDVATGDVVRDIYLPHHCYDALASPDGEHIYLSATFGSDKIVIVDTETNAVTGEIDVLMPCGMVISPDAQRMFVTNVYANSLQVVDLETNAVTATAPMGEIPCYIELTQDGSRAFICHPTTDTVTVVDTETLEVVSTIEVDPGPCAVAIGTVG